LKTEHTDFLMQDIPMCY